MLQVIASAAVKDVFKTASLVVFQGRSIQYFRVFLGFVTDSLASREEFAVSGENKGDACAISSFVDEVGFGEVPVALLFVIELGKVWQAVADSHKACCNVLVHGETGALDSAVPELRSEGVDFCRLSSWDGFTEEGHRRDPGAGLGVHPNLLCNGGDEGGEELLQGDEGLCAVVGVLPGTVAKGLNIKVASLIGETKPSDW